MDPFTIALATFGIQKLRGKSTKRSLRDAAIAGGIGQLAGMAGIGQGTMGSFAPQAFGSTGNVIAGEGLKAQLGNTLAGQGISSLIGQKPLSTEQLGTMTADEIAAAGGKEALLKGSGFMGLSKGAQLGVGLGAMSLLGEDEPVKMPEGTSPEDYAKAKEKADKQLANILDTYDYEGEAAGISPYSYQQGNSLFTFNKGGIAEIKKFNTGGINYLPSKIDHDETDTNNYVRASGYVEDGAGAGDKDEDTMLAQLADGEFVSRADAILGAGIMEGGDPKSYKDMRKKGAAFFYDQQAKFKRIFDLLDASRKKAN
tara:strand:+ start:2042 stop:2980 length:939 start_codon:yes stop_codon:yes gene_type:complete